MILAIESIVLCLLFTLMVYGMFREPIKQLYNYPPKIQERVRSLPEYEGAVPRCAFHGDLMRKTKAARR